MDYDNCSICGYDFSTLNINTNPKNVVLIPMGFDVNYIYYPGLTDTIRKNEYEFLQSYKFIKAKYLKGVFLTDQTFTINLSDNPSDPYEMELGLTTRGYLRHSINVICNPYCEECYKKKITITL